MDATGVLALAFADKQAHASAMKIFKCPHCRTEYEMVMAPISFRQRSYAKCEVCSKTMYSWNSSHVPRFTIVRQSPVKAPVRV